MSHKVRYKVERRLTPGSSIIEELNVIAETTGEVRDLYDWHAEVSGFAQHPAILQIGFGKGNYGPARDRGKIYISDTIFDDGYEIKQLSIWP